MRWPFFVLYGIMWLSMFLTTQNADPIRLGLSLSVVLGMAAIAGTIVFLAQRRWNEKPFFDFGHRTIIGNLGRHIFLLTRIVFISYLFFDAVTQMLIVGFHVRLFEPDCVVSERDTALFVWDAMAKGAFKVFARYLHLPTGACEPASNWNVTLLQQGIRWFTALVVVWYALSFAEAWIARLRRKPPTI